MIYIYIVNMIVLRRSVNSIEDWAVYEYIWSAVRHYWLRNTIMYGSKVGCITSFFFLWTRLESRRVLIYTPNKYLFILQKTTFNTVWKV